MSYAEKTTVPIQRSQQEIENLIRVHGGTHFTRGETPTKVWLAFRHGGETNWRAVKFQIPSPNPKDRRFTHVLPRGYAFEQQRTAKQAQEAFDQEMRRNWRALLLVIKAKFEAVESKVENFESAFMAEIVMPDGRTIAETLGAQIEESYQRGANRLALSQFAGEDGRGQ